MRMAPTDRPGVPGEFDGASLVDCTIERRYQPLKIIVRPG
jgi:hypothetical protein